MKNSKYPIWKKALGLVALLFFTVSLSAQTTYYSRQDGDWDVAATWSTIACGDAIAAGTPGAGDDIVICAGDTVTMVVNTTLRHLTINSNGTLNQDGNRSTITGNYVNNGTHDGGDDRVQLTGVGTTLDGTGIVINPNPFRLEVGDKTILATANLTINNSAGNNRGHVRDNITVTNNGSITYTRDIQSFGGSETWINAANSTLRIGEDFFPNGGTLDATAPGNTVEYNGGAGAQTLYDPSGFTYWHLTIYGGGTKTPDGGGNLDINGNLTISSAFDIDAAGIDITVAGNWSNTGTFIEGTRKVTLDGSGSQSLSATGGETFYDLEIVKGTGTLTCNDNVTVSTTAGGTLTMTSGNIDMKTNVLTLGTAATNLGTLTRVSGTIIGKFERWINTTVSPGPPVLYPVGTASDYRPANVTFNSLPTNGSLIGEFADSDPRDYGNPWSDGPETARNTFSEGYWILTVNNGLTSADYNVELTGTNFTSFSPFVAETRVLVRQNETFDWGIDGNQVAADVSTKTGKRNNITTLTAHLCLADTTNCSPPVTSAIVGVDSVCTNATGENYSVNSQDGSSYSWIVAGGTIASSGIKQSYTPTSDFNTFISFPPLQDLSLINDGDLDTGTIWGPATPDPYELTMTFPASVAIDSVRVRGGQADGDLNKPTEMKLYRGTSAGTLLLTINPVSYTMTGYGFSNDTTSTVYTWVFTPAASNSGIREIECYSSNGITVDWNAIGGTGTLQVTETNACGVGALATKNINKHPLPTSAITGSSSVAENSTGEAYSVINNPGYTYTWTITGGTQATGGTSNSITVNWGTSGTGEVKVVANAVGCGSAAADSITITITDVVISVQDGDWDVPSTWDCNCNPPDGANAIISTGDTVTLTVNETINNLTLSANSRLNNDGNRMTITGNYKNDGVHDGGSDRVALTGTATTIDGTGTVFNANAFRLEIGNKTILSTANLTISTNGNIVEIRNGITVVNNGTFIVSGGDLRDNNAGTVWTNATNSTLKVTHRCLDFNAAVLNASASGNLVEYNGTANQDIKQPSGNTYWHLTLGGGGTKSLQNANHDINGNIIISSIFDINGLDISLAGNWTNTGTFTEGTRKVTLDGATDQTIINGSTEQFYDLTINKSAGKVILNDNVIVANTLDLVSRNIDAKTNNKKLTLGTGTGNIGTLSRTSGHIIGQFERWVDATGTWYYWPVGTTGDYRPDSVRLNTASTFGSLISEFVETDPQDYGNPWIDAGDTVFRTFSEGYWAVTKANSLTTSDFDLRLTGTGFTSYNFAPGTRLLTRINETFDWGIDGTHVTASASTTRRSNVATLSGHFCWGDTTHCTNPVTSVITGSDSVCINDAAVPYSVVDGNGNTFTWTITGGLKASGGTSGSITIDWGSTGMVGNVQVVEQNALGCSGDPVNRAVNIHTLPTSAITGSALVEENTTAVAYSVTNNTGYTYTWTITGGTQATGGTTNSITVNWGTAGAGKVSVSASTGCSTAATVDLDVTVYGNIISVKTGNWNDPTTWDCNCNPADNDNAIIDTGDTVYVTLDETINHLTIRATARLEHNAGRQITVNGNYTSNSIHDAGGDRIFLYGAGANMDGTAIVNNVSQFGIRYGTTILSTANFTVNITAGGDARVYNNVTNNGIIEFNGDVNNGGSGVWINATNSIVKFGGTVAPAITASATGNTVEYDEAGNQNIVTPSSGIYYHLIASGGGIKSLLGNLDINGDLTISSTLNSNGRDLNLAGHWSNTGAFTEGTRTVTIDGSADQTITNASVERFFNLTINKAAGKWILNDNVEVEGTFTLTSGNVDAKTNSKKLTVGISTAATGALTYTSGHVIGQLERWVASTGTWFLWPVGTNLDYRPNSVQLNTVTTFGSLISEFIDTDPQDYGNPWLDGADSVFRTFSEGYWDLTRANSLLVTSYDLDLTGNGFTSAIISGGTRIMTRPDALTDWGLSGTHATATGNTTRRTGVATLSAHHCFGDTTHCTTPVTSGITGVDSVCINQSAVSYFVTNTGGSTYTWTIVGGLKATGGTTSSITVDWGATGMVGSVQVVEKNTLGCSGDPVIKTVNIHTMPTSAITGSISEAENTTGVPYSVIDRAGYTYTWTITGGTQVTGGTTNSITVNWGSAGAGKVSVSASTGCSTAATVDLDVTLFGTIISVQTGNWDVPSTWDCNCNPADIDNAIIDAGHTVTVTVDEIINNLTVRATATLQHNAVRQITITGDYTNNGMHNGGADRILLDGAGNIDGTGTVTNVDQFRMMNGNRVVLSSLN
ncbi:MAG: hypothetical protein JKX74_06215, partial [Flavobacteriales bacterium]|nr:hypothetical protein [Flavobacteriales bacterium]